MMWYSVLSSLHHCLIKVCAVWGCDCGSCGHTSVSFCHPCCCCCCLLLLVRIQDESITIMLWLHDIKKTVTKKSVEYLRPTLVWWPYPALNFKLGWQSWCDIHFVPTESLFCNFCSEYPPALGHCMRGVQLEVQVGYLISAHVQVWFCDYHTNVFRRK